MKKRLETPLLTVLKLYDYRERYIVYSVHLPLCSDVRAYSSERTFIILRVIILRWRMKPRGQRRITARTRKCCANQCYTL